MDENSNQNNLLDDLDEHVSFCYYCCFVVVVGGSGDCGGGGYGVCDGIIYSCCYCLLHTFINSLVGIWCRLTLAKSDTEVENQSYQNTW